MKKKGSTVWMFTNYVLVYRDWLRVLSLDFHICNIWFVFSVLLLAPQSQIGCLTAKPLVVDLKENKSNKRNVNGAQ